MGDLYGLKFDKEKCTGCAAANPPCPFGLITILDDKASIKIEGCNVCGACEDACATEAIKIEKEMAQSPVDSEHRGVWVFAEQRNGENQRRRSGTALKKAGNWPILYKPNYVPSVWDMISKALSNLLPRRG